MPRRYLFGPVTAAFADQNLRRQREAGECLTFDPTGAAGLRVGSSDTWEAVCSRLPTGWRLDFIVLDLHYSSVPACLWSVPVPLVGLAADCNLLWHHYRRRLPVCELVLTDSASVTALARAGIQQARAANLFGCERAFLEEPATAPPRDIDILFVGNLNQAVQRERLPWLARLARLAERWRVVVRTNVYGAEYRGLLRRARIVFNRSIRGEANMRTFEAVAAGALLFQEADNAEVAAHFRPGHEYVEYTGADLEQRLEYYLEHEEERRVMARAARTRVAGYSFQALWDEHLRLIDAEWDALVERAAQRRLPAGDDALLARTWQVLCANHCDDPSLIANLEAAVAARPHAAALHQALALATVGLRPRAERLTPQAAAAVADHFRRAWEADPADLLAGLNLTEALVQSGHCLVHPYRGEGFGLPLAEAMACGLPTILTGYGAALDFCDEASSFLLPARLRYFPTKRVGERETVIHPWLAEPDAGVLAQMLRHVFENPEEARRRGQVGSVRIRQHFTWERSAAVLERHLEELCGRPARREGATRPAVTARAVQATPARSRVSLCMIVKNEEANLRRCLGSVADLLDEMVLVDTGSSDKTRELARELGARVVDFTWIGDFAAARNEGLRHARGDWIFWLDGDEWLDEANRGRLRRLLGRLPEGNAAYLMRQLSQPQDPGGPTTAVDQVRLFRKRADVRWEYRVHEQLMPAVRRSGAEVFQTDLVIKHAGYEDAALRQRKLERNLRLLRLSQTEQPDDAVVLYHLGWALLQSGDAAAARPLLERSLEQTAPEVSIGPKLHALLARASWKVGELGAALESCRVGLARYAGDTELHFLEAALLREQGDLAAAEVALQRLLQATPGTCLPGVDLALAGWKARALLAQIHADQKQSAEAEAQWRAVLAEQPKFRLAWLGLAKACLAGGRWAPLDEVLSKLEALPGDSDEIALLRARARIARGD